MAKHEITQALQRLADGHGSAVERILPLVYDELRELARSYMRRQPAGHTLQPTALVNEACVRMLGSSVIPPQNRIHFFAIAATAMRQVLANHARAKQADKRAAGGRRMTLSAAITPGGSSEIDIVDLHDALAELARLDERQARLVELRFLGGMTTEEAAQALGVSPATIGREWRMARAWLSARLRGGANA